MHTAGDPDRVATVSSAGGRSSWSVSDDDTVIRGIERLNGVTCNGPDNPGSAQIASESPHSAPARGRRLPTIQG